MIFEVYIFLRIFKKRELRENMYNATISTFTVYLSVYFCYAKGKHPNEVTIMVHFLITELLMGLYSKGVIRAFSEVLCM